MHTREAGEQAFGSQEVKGFKIFITCVPRGQDKNILVKQEVHTLTMFLPLPCLPVNERFFSSDVAFLIFPLSIILTCFQNASSRFFTREATKKQLGFRFVLPCLLFGGTVQQFSNANSLKNLLCLHTIATHNLKISAMYFEIGNILT